MKFISDEEASHRIAPKKNRCVWMEAGILSYLLCDREFDCDHCPLDEAMRSHFSDVRKDQNNVTSDAGERTARYTATDLRYTRNHCWIEPISDIRCRIGFEPGLSRTLTTLKSLVLPAVGQRISPKMFCAWVIMEGGTLPLKLPLKGTVRQVNPLLADQPHLICLSPTDQGWLFEVDVDDSRFFTSLHSATGIREYYDGDEEAFRKLATAGLSRVGPDVGQTSQDGGRILDNLATLLGPVKYLTIIRRVYMGKS